MSTLTTACQSFAGFISLTLHGELKLKRRRVGKDYAVENGIYEIFRETESLKVEGETVILVIGFRLKLIRSNAFLHWVFQRVCILTTPFWSGLTGFKTKLWMVDPKTNNYLGIYDWRGKKEAKKYLDFLLPVLNFFSVPSSVWAQQIYRQNFENFLIKHELKK
jgi:hypothetical protein